MQTGGPDPIIRAFPVLEGLSEGALARALDRSQLHRGNLYSSLCSFARLVGKGPAALPARRRPTSSVTGALHTNAALGSGVIWLD